MDQPANPAIEAQISEWRAYLLRRDTLHHVDVDELEDHLRTEVAELGAAGLTADESILVAIRRMGGVNELSREFARERSNRLWKQLVIGGDTGREQSLVDYAAFAIMASFAVGAALAFKLPVLFGINPFDSGTADSSGTDIDGAFYLRNTALLVLPFLIGFFAWKRSLPRRVVVTLAVPFLAAAVLINALPFDTGGDTEILASVHLPIILWLVAGVAYLGGAWRSDAPRMDFVRFTGEWFIYYALIAFGGGVLSALTIGIFDAIEIDVVPVVGEWVLPCGAVGAIVVVAWLVEAKQSVIENMAPVLTSVFTPLFALMLVAAVLGMAFTGNFVDADRDVLILFDLLLVVVLGLVLYSISARDSNAAPTLMDGAQLVLIVSALVIDLFALTAMLGRIIDFGFTPNRAAGLGLNIVLLANLTWSAWLLTAFLRHKRPFAHLERWQTAYIPVFGAWAAIVVIVFPPLFAFD